MDFLNKLYKEVKNGVDVACERNKAIAVKNRLKIVVKSQQDELDCLYIRLGKIYFENSAEKCEEEITLIKTKIQQYNDAIEISNKKIKSIEYYIKCGMPKSLQYVSDLFELDDSFIGNDEESENTNLSSINTDAIDFEEQICDPMQKDIPEENHIVYTPAPLQDVEIPVAEQTKKDDTIDDFWAVKDALADEDK